MKILIKSTLCLFALSSVLVCTEADGPSTKLPEPGSWVRYQHSNKPSSGGEVTARLTLRALDRVVVDKMPCRWFESEYVSDTDYGQERSKFLISEHTFTSGERPLDAALKFLSQDNADPATFMSPDSRAWIITDFLHFPGFLKNAQLVDAPRTIAYQGGTLSVSQAHVGSYKWWPKDRSPETTSVFESKYEVWLHPDLPTGFAHAKVRLGISYQGKESRFYEIECRLQDFGTDAKSSISGEPTSLEGR